jgi:hypothetical protein
MNARHQTLAALGAALLLMSLAPAAAFAVTPPEPSAFALPAGSLALDAVPILAGATPQVSAVHVAAMPELEFAGVEYRPRNTQTTVPPAMPPATNPHRGSELKTLTQIYGGIFQLDRRPDNNAYFGGLRVGPMLGKHAQIGGMFDWIHDTSHESNFETQVEGPGGVPIDTRYDISRSTTDLFPLMAFIQLSGWGKLAIMPYVGAAGGYQWLNLHAENYETGHTFDSTYGGLGWQVWAGAGLPIAKGTKLTGELFLNGGDLGRDEVDPYNTVIYHENVNVNGVGARFGLAWGL